MELNESKIKLKKAIELRQKNKLKEALNIILELEKFFPNNHYILLEKGLELKKLKYYEKAIPIFEKLLYTDRRNIALLELGNIYYLLNKYSKAIEYYEDLYSEALYQDGNIAYYDKTSSLHHLGDCYHLLDQNDKAFLYYNTLLNETLTNPYRKKSDKLFVYSKLGNLYLEQGQVKQALTNYNLASQNNIIYSIIALLQIATIYLNNHDLTKTQQTLEKIINTNINLKEQKENIILNAKFLLAKSYIMDYNFEMAQSLLKSLKNTIYQKKSLEQLIYINFKLEKYENVLNLINSHNFLLNENQNIKNIYLISQNRLGIPIASSSLGFNNYNSYNKEKIFNKIDKHLNLQKSAKDICNELNLSKENFYGNDLYDNYYFTFPQIGIVDDQITDFIKVKTLINSDKVIDIIPCKSLNNELKCQDEKITLQKIR